MRNSGQTLVILGNVFHTLDTDFVAIVQRDGTSSVFEKHNGAIVIVGLCAASRGDRPACIDGGPTGILQLDRMGPAAADAAGYDVTAAIGAEYEGVAAAIAF